MFIFPSALAPPPPFPLVLAVSAQNAFVAPGVQRADYYLSTSSGPLVVHLVVADPSEATLRFGVVLADDRLTSLGETTSSMALRSGAIAGVNADYYDIGQTNQPLGIVVQNSELVRTPSKRAALEVLRDKTVRFTTFRFSGRLTYGSTTIPLTTVDEWPPQGGASFLTRAYGTLKPLPGVQTATLASLSGDGKIGGAYRVVSIGDVSVATPVRAPMIAFGPAALAIAPPPNVGDSIEVQTALDPSLDDITSAVGGGPLLIAKSAPVEDPNAPAPEERDRRFPVSGAATLSDGTLILLAVDGRQPAQSLGITRPEFAALMLGFGANEGMAFDSGGSSTLVARILGDDRPTVLNVPSDGSERAVADGFFVYSDAPSGGNPHLVINPPTFNALSGTLVTLRGAIVDDAGHRLRAASISPIVAASEPGPHAVVVREIGGDASATLTYRTLTTLAKLSIEPSDVNPNAGATVEFRARGFEVSGEPVEVGAARWTATAGTIAADGTYHAGTRDATVVATIGGALASATVRVGRHAAHIAFPSDGTRFETYPRGGSGALEHLSAGAEGDRWNLRYDFSGAERAAYATGAAPLPGIPLAFGLDVLGHGDGAALRLAFTNRFGERRALTLAKSVDWSGWRHLEIPMPADLTPPVTLVSLYVVALPGTKPAHGTGEIGFRDPIVVVAGTP
jgi:hypothetical protein